MFGASNRLSFDGIAVVFSHSRCWRSCCFSCITFSRAPTHWEEIDFGWWHLFFTWRCKSTAMEETAQRRSQRQTTKHHWLFLTLHKNISVTATDWMWRLLFPQLMPLCLNTLWSAVTYSNTTRKEETRDSLTRFANTLYDLDHNLDLIKVTVTLQASKLNSTFDYTWKRGQPAAPLGITDVNNLFKNVACWLA